MDICIRCKRLLPLGRFFRPAPIIYPARQDAPESILRHYPTRCLILLHQKPPEAILGPIPTKVTDHDHDGSQSPILSQPALLLVKTIALLFPVLVFRFYQSLNKSGVSGFLRLFHHILKGDTM